MSLTSEFGEKFKRKVSKYWDYLESPYLYNTQSCALAFLTRVQYIRTIEEWEFVYDYLLTHPIDFNGGAFQFVLTEKEDCWLVEYLRDNPNVTVSTFKNPIHNYFVNLVTVILER